MGTWGNFFIFNLKKLNLDISLITATFIHTSSDLVGALSVLLGGFGSIDSFTVSILKLQSIPIDYGIPITSIIRLMTLWYITFLGLLSLLFIRAEVFKDV